MEKQLVLRSIGPNLPVMIVTYGSIKDGQFVPEEVSLERLSQFMTVDSAALVESDDLFGSSTYIRKKHLFPFMENLFCHGSVLDVEYYDSFMVFKLDVYEEQEEKTEKE